MRSDTQVLVEAYRTVLENGGAQQVNVSALINGLAELQNSINTYKDVLPKDANMVHPVFAHDLQLIKQAQEIIFDITGKYTNTPQ